MTVQFLLTGAMSPQSHTQEVEEPSVSVAFLSSMCFLDQEQCMHCFNLLPQPIKKKKLSSVIQMKNALYTPCAPVKGWHKERSCVVPTLRLWICCLQRCTVFYSCSLSLVASTLEGYYVDDALQGQGIYTYEDGVVLHGTYVDGELNGPAQEYDSDGRLIFKGQYKDNIRHGVCWIYYPVSLTSRSLFC